MRAAVPKDYENDFTQIMTWCRNLLNLKIFEYVRNNNSSYDKHSHIWSYLIIFCERVLYHRQYEKLSEIAEEKKADFAKFEQEDIKCREDLKHTKERQKKLVKSLEKERAKVRIVLHCVFTDKWLGFCLPRRGKEK